MEEEQSLHDEHMQELLHEETFWEKIDRIKEGLKADPETGEYKWAKHEFTRLIVPASVSFVTLTVLIIALIVFVKFDTEGEPTEVEVTIVEPEVIEPPPPEPPEPPEDYEPPEMDVEPSDVVAEVETDVTTDEVMENVPTETSVKPTEVTAVMSVTSPIMLKSLFANRSPGQRGKALAAYGGGSATEDSVLKALRWLKRKQNADGSWAGSGSNTAMAGLALLCYLAHGDTPQSKEFGHTVEMAIKYLVSQQEASGNFKGTGSHHSYGNAIANYALAEAYGLTRIYALKEVVDKGIKILVDGQQKGGGWDYNYKDGGRTDLSVMAWQAQALKAAGIAGCETEGLEDAKYKAIPAFKGMQGGGGGFGYTSPGAGPLAGAGVLCLQLLGEGASPEVRKGLEYMYEWRMNWENASAGGVKKDPMYHWYYITQAKFQTGGGEWNAWNDVMSKVLPAAQHADGHWLNEGGKGHAVSDVLHTTLGCLMLEVYYRYLPTFKAEGVGHEDAPGKKPVGGALQALEQDNVIKVL